MSGSYLHLRGTENEDRDRDQEIGEVRNRERCPLFVSGFGSSVSSSQPQNHTTVYHKTIAGMPAGLGTAALLPSLPLGPLSMVSGCGIERSLAATRPFLSFQVTVCPCGAGGSGSKSVILGIRIESGGVFLRYTNPHAGSNCVIQLGLRAKPNKMALGTVYLPHM